MDSHPSLPLPTSAISVRASAQVRGMQMWACVFFPLSWAQRGTRCTGSLYLISFCYPHTISPFCASRLVSLAHSDLALSRFPLSFHTFFFSLTPLFNFAIFFLPLNLLGWAHYTCRPFRSFCPATVVLQGSACQLTKRTLRSMVITSPSHTPSTLSVISAARLFSYIWRDCFVSKTYESYAYSRKLFKKKKKKKSQQNNCADWGWPIWKRYGLDCFQRAVFTYGSAFCFLLFLPAYFLLFGLLCLCGLGGLFFLN